MGRIGNRVDGLVNRVFEIQKNLCAVLSQIVWRCGAATSGAARTFGEGLRRSTVAHFARKVRGTNIVVA